MDLHIITSGMTNNKRLSRLKKNVPKGSSYSSTAQSEKNSVLDKKAFGFVVPKLLAKFHEAQEGVNE